MIVAALGLAGFACFFLGAWLSTRSHVAFRAGLVEERDRLREALEEIGKYTEDEAAMEIAKQALAGEKPDA